jgi:hypothetical protein
VDISGDANEVCYRPLEINAISADWFRRMTYVAVCGAKSESSIKSFFYMVNGVNNSGGQF